MKRDMDLMRELMLRLEALPMGLGDAVTITPEDPAVAVEGYDVVQINHHLDLIREAGFIDDGGGSQPMLGFIFCGLTGKGHDFIDAVRSPEIWRKTKAGAKEIGGWSVDLLWGLAKEYAKQVAKEKLGVSLS